MVILTSFTSDLFIFEFLLTRGLSSRILAVALHRPLNGKTGSFFNPTYTKNRLSWGQLRWHKYQNEMNLPYIGTGSGLIKAFFDFVNNISVAFI
jgi:hypothetical protein